MICPFVWLIQINPFQFYLWITKSQRMSSQGSFPSLKSVLLRKIDCCHHHTNSLLLQTLCSQWFRCIKWKTREEAAQCSVETNTEFMKLPLNLETVQSCCRCATPQSFCDSVTLVSWGGATVCSDAQQPNLTPAYSRSVYSLPCSLMSCEFLLVGIFRFAAFVFWRSNRLTALFPPDMKQSVNFSPCRGLRFEPVWLLWSLFPACGVVKMK